MANIDAIRKRYNTIRRMNHIKPVNYTVSAESGGEDRYSQKEFVYGPEKFVYGPEEPNLLKDSRLSLALSGQEAPDFTQVRKNPLGMTAANKDNAATSPLQRLREELERNDEQNSSVLPDSAFGAYTLQEGKSAEQKFSQIDDLYNEYKSLWYNTEDGRYRLDGEARKTAQSLVDSLKNQLGSKVNSSSSTPLEKTLARSYAGLFEDMLAGGSYTQLAISEFARGIPSSIESTASGLTGMLGDAMSGGKYSEGYKALDSYFSEHPAAFRDIQAGKNIWTQDILEKTGVPLNIFNAYLASTHQDALQTQNYDSFTQNLNKKTAEKVGNTAFTIGQQIPGIMLTSGAPAVEGGGGLLGKLADGAKLKEAIAQALSGNLSTYIMGASSMGGSYNETMRTKDYDWRNYVNALGQGFAEYFTEGLFGFSDMSSYQAFFDAPAGKAGSRVLKGIFRWLTAGAEEGLEEVANVPLGGFVDLMTGQADEAMIDGFWSWNAPFESEGFVGAKSLFEKGGIFDVREMFESGIDGTIAGLLMGSAGAILSTAESVREGKDIRSGVARLNAIAKQSLPEAYRPAALDQNTARAEDVTAYRDLLMESIANYADHMKRLKTGSGTFDLTGVTRGYTANDVDLSGMELNSVGQEMETGSSSGMTNETALSIEKVEDTDVGSLIERIALGLSTEDRIVLKGAYESYQAARGEESIPPALFISEYRTAYEYGKSGASLDTARASDGLQDLSAATIRAAHSAGAAARDAAWRADLARQRGTVSDSAEEAENAAQQMVEEQASAVRDMANDFNIDTVLSGMEHVSAPLRQTIRTLYAKYGDENDPVEFTDAISTAYNYGTAGLSLESAQGAVDGDYGAAVREAYDAGVSSEMEKTGARLDEIKRGAVSAPDGTKLVRRRGSVRAESGVSIDSIRKKYNDPQRQALRLLQVIADVTGLDIVLYESAQNKNGEFTDAQGRFSWSEDKSAVYVDVNAGLLTGRDIGDLGKYTLMRTFAHEFTHFLENWNPAYYTEFRKLVFRYMEEGGADPASLVALKIAGDESGRMTHGQASREVVAEAMTDILPQSRFLEEIADGSPKLFAVLRDKLKAFLSDIKRHFAAMYENRSQEARALKRVTEDGLAYVEEVVRAFDRLASGAIANYQSNVSTIEKAQKIEEETKSKTKPKEASKAEIMPAGMPEKGTPSERIAAIIVSEYLKKGAQLTSKALYELTDRAFGGTQAEGAYNRKDAYDALELAINQYLLQRITKNPELFNGSTENAVLAETELQNLLSLLPTQTVRTKEQQDFQQFSTPPNIAYLAAWVANITEGDFALEPSAGIGGLAVFAKAFGAKVAVNELSTRRLGVLRSMNFDYYFNENAEQINNILPENIKPTTVLMNPPFSATAGRTATNKTSNAIRHMEQALERLENGGRLVAILGRGMANDAPSFRAWWNSLRKEYSIRANIGIDGSNYSKYGTSFDVQLVVIDKTGPQEGMSITGSYKNLSEIPEVLEGIRNDRNRTTEQNAPVAEREKVHREAGTGRFVSDAVSVGASRRGIDGESEQISGVRPARDTAGIDSRIESEASISEDDNKRESGQRGKRGTSQRASEIVEGGYGRFGRGTAEQSNNVVSDGARVPGTPLEESRQEVKNDDGVYADYKTPDIPVKGSKSHPAHLVESAAMAAVPMPKAVYVPHIPTDVAQNNLSKEQMVSVVYAGQAHEQLLPDGKRKGFFIGDGTGVGKGRQISAIILDNYMQGRKKSVWISMNASLYDDAVRDWTDTTGRDKGAVFNFSKTKLGAPVESKEGILYTTYDTLRMAKDGKSRLDQIVNWLGKDFDGVIAFDEAHNMGNYLGKNGKRGKTKPSEKAKAAVELQNRLPNARVLYVSATAATEVDGLAFAGRLGLWGKGTSFADVRDFVAKIGSSGLAAMELVVRDLKSLGSYVARSISYQGVAYETLQHDLDGMQTTIYNTMSKAWQITMKNIVQALVLTGGNKNSNARANAMGQYYSAMQRFYSQVLTSMSMPSVIADIRKELANGRSCVLQIVNTYQAETDRQIARAKASGDSLEDLDLTPRGTLLQYLTNSFPVQMFEEYTDEDGNTSSRAVMDSKGNSVLDKNAVRMRDALIEQINQISIPDSPLDMLFDAFGTDGISEITGRTRRVVPKKMEDGSIIRAEESRTKNHTAADVQAFQDGKKRILVFSDAGGTGKSYHASRTAVNQQQRVHYVLQPGWVASKAVQGFGRTHRSNQASAPIYKLVTTNIKGQKRFTSTIARRLDQLGALTKGQRNTGSGMFGANDNLETDLAKDSLREFYRRLGNNQIEGISGMDVLERLGLKDRFSDEYGNFKVDENVARDMSIFLNRILALEVDEQNRIFDSFVSIYETEMDAAIQAGTLDTGMENVKADKIEILDDKIIRKADKDGSETHYVQAKTYRKPQIVTTVAELVDKRNGFVGLYKTNDGDIRAVYRIADKTTERGAVKKQFRLYGPNFTGKSNTWTEETLISKATPIDKATWQSEWDAEIKKVPEYNEQVIHMLTGTLLPIWNDLPQDGSTRVYRLMADDGSMYLGRVINPTQIDGVLRHFSVDRKKEAFTPQQVMREAIENGKRFYLQNGHEQIFRSRVSGQWRLELTGSNSWYFLRKYNGLIAERISYHDRFFIPVGPAGEEVLKNILNTNPVRYTDSDGDGTQYQKRGINQYGIEVYETSAETLSLSFHERISRYLDLMANEFRGRTARFKRNGHTYYARFDPNDLRKPVYGDNRSDSGGKKALIRTGADGDIFDLLDDANYKYSSPDRKNHKGTDYFDYFIKTVQIDGRVYDLHADVKKQYGKDGGYVYTLYLSNNKKLKASPAAGSMNGPVKDADNALSKTSIASASLIVNEENSQSQPRSRTYSNREILTEAAALLEEDQKIKKTFTEGELDALRIFQNRLGALESFTRQRRELGEQYRTAQFTKDGNRAEAGQILERMKLMDAKIKAAENLVLSLENKEVLKRVLQKSRDIVEKREKLRSQETLRQYRMKRAESAARIKYRTRIQKDASDLMKWIADPDTKKHVPAFLQEVVSDFISSINFSSKRQLTGNAATKQDKAFQKSLSNMLSVVMDAKRGVEAYNGYLDLPQDFLDELQEIIQKTQTIIDHGTEERVLNQMSADELESLSKIIKAVKSVVVNANRFLAENAFRHVSDAGQDTINTLRRRGAAQQHQKMKKISEFFNWNNVLPIYGFDRMGKGGKAMFTELRHGMTQESINAREIIAFAEKTYTAQEVRAWEKELHTIQCSEEDVTVTTAQLMELYNLMKRRQGLGHVTGGGVRFSDYTSEHGKNVHHAGNVITDAELESAVNLLTDRQRQVADAMREFASTVGSRWGNEVSMKRFGYEQFTEKHYWPIKSDASLMNEAASHEGNPLWTLLNKSFTKPLTPNANNRVVIGSAFDTFSSHMSDMAQYNALALPLLDSLKWFNYQQQTELDNGRVDKSSVRQQMENTYGDAAVHFVRSVLQDVSGSKMNVGEDSLAIGMVKRANRAAVAANLRVALLQPVSIARASLVLGVRDILSGGAKNLVKIN